MVKAQEKMMDFQKVKRCKVTQDGNDKTFCGPAVLKRWNIEVTNRPMMDREIHQALELNGCKIVSSKSTIHIQDEVTGTKLHERPFTKSYATVTKFIEYVQENLAEDYDVVFFTDHHVLCMKDAVLTDTDRKATGRRRVTHYYLIEK